MSFGDRIRALTSLARSDTRRKLNEAKSSLPLQWVEQNIDLIREGILYAAQQGKNELELSSLGVFTAAGHRSWQQVSNEAYQIGFVENAEFEDEIVRCLTHELRKDRIRVERWYRDGRYRGKKFTYHLWVIHW